MRYVLLYNTTSTTTAQDTGFSITHVKTKASRFPLGDQDNGFEGLLSNLFCSHILNLVDIIVNHLFVTFLITLIRCFSSDLSATLFVLNLSL